jgi:ABC-type nitrate/sulfonate/bicarbonate transport system substrate-binding protein
MGSDNGFLSIIGGKDVRSLGELKGRKLAVDALTTGYAFVLRELLARAGADYLGVVGAARRSWAKQNEKALEGFIRAYRDGVAFLYENRPIAEALLVANMRAMTPELARRSLDVFLDEKTGFYKDVRLDAKGMRTVLELRSKFAGKRLTDPGRYL